MHNQDWAVNIYLISQILHLYMISSIDLSFLNILCMITWFISFIHFFLPSFLFVHSSFHLNVYSFIIYNYSVNMMYISSPYSSPPFDEKKSNKQKNTKNRTVTQSCSRGTPSRVPYLSGDGFPPPVRVTPSSPRGQSPYHWAGNALDLSCTSQWTYS